MPRYRYKTIEYTHTNCKKYGQFQELVKNIENIQECVLYLPYVRSKKTEGVFQEN